MAQLYEILWFQRLHVCGYFFCCCFFMIMKNWRSQLSLPPFTVYLRLHQSRWPYTALSVSRRVPEKMLHERYISCPTREVPQRPTQRHTNAPPVPRRLRWSTGLLLLGLVSKVMSIFRGTEELERQCVPLQHPCGFNKNPHIETTFYFVCCFAFIHFMHQCPKQGNSAP